MLAYEFLNEDNEMVAITFKIHVVNVKLQVELILNAVYHRHGLIKD